MSDQLAPITDDYLQAMHGPCAIGSYQRKELIAYRDGGEKTGVILWIRATCKGVRYVVDDGEFNCILVPEENVIGVVRQVQELSPV